MTHYYDEPIEVGNNGFLEVGKKRKVGETVLVDLVSLLDFQLKSHLKMLRNVNDVLIFGGHSWCFRCIAHFK